jgi:hypothetical protein
MQPNALLTRQNFIVVKSGCYTLLYMYANIDGMDKYFE